MSSQSVRFQIYEGGSKEETCNRSTLRSAMEAEGFMVNPNEWWHFDFYLWSHPGA
jgi:D-alanyl-D-alanine dipeptidase